MSHPLFTVRSATLLISYCAFFSVHADAPLRKLPIPSSSFASPGRIIRPRLPMHRVSTAYEVLACLVQWPRSLEERNAAGQTPLEFFVQQQVDRVNHIMTTRRWNPYEKPILPVICALLLAGADRTQVAPPASTTTGPLEFLRRMVLPTTTNSDLRIALIRSRVHPSLCSALAHYQKVHMQEEE